MAVVVDASIAVNFLLTQVYSIQAEQYLDGWKSVGETLYAPAHWYAEIVSALRFAVYRRKLDAPDAQSLIDVLPDLGVRAVQPTPNLLKSSLHWAERLGQSKAYDAQYVALAEYLKAELWSADQRLIHALKDQGIPWAHWIGEEFQGL
jgi:predicted nucleic acid-binding protein